MRAPHPPARRRLLARRYAAGLHRRRLAQPTKSGRGRVSAAVHLGSVRTANTGGVPNSTRTNPHRNTSRVIHRTRKRGQAMARRESFETDTDWENFARDDPYWAVLTDARFREAKNDPGSRATFFEGGEWQIQEVFDHIRAHVDPDFAPQRALDFGCGV